MKRDLAHYLAAFWLGLALLVANPALADPSKAELADAKAVEARGAEMFAYDQAAWHSTDALSEELDDKGKSFASISKEGFRGFVVEPASDGLLLVTYHGEKDGNKFAMARYWMRGNSVVRGGMLKAGDDRSLSPLALKLIEIRGKLMDAAIADEIGVCGRARPNTVILPPRADGTIPAYLMSAQEKTGTFPAGGHHLNVFDTNGKLLRHRAFTKSCVRVDWGSLPKDAAGYGVSHMLDPGPTEIHVFTSLMMPIPLFVITDQNKFMWQIDQGKITFKQVMKDEDLPK